MMHGTMNVKFVINIFQIEISKHNSTITLRTTRWPTT